MAAAPGYRSGSTGASRRRRRRCLAWMVLMAAAGRPWGCGWGRLGLSSTPLSLQPITPAIRVVLPTRVTIAVGGLNSSAACFGGGGGGGSQACEHKLRSSRSGYSGQGGGLPAATVAAANLAAVQIPETVFDCLSRRRRRRRREFGAGNWRPLRHSVTGPAAAAGFGTESADNGSRHPY
jgi:hypothetical protein